MHKQNPRFFHSRKPVVLVILIGVLLAVLGVPIHWRLTVLQSGDPDPSINQPSSEAEEMKMTTHIMLTSLNKPWDIVFAGEDMIVAENDGLISLASEGKKMPILQVPKIDPSGEGGLMGLAVDPQYTENHFLYACYNTAGDIRVSRWVLNETASELSAQKDIITGIQSNSGANPGRHSGCRMNFGPDGFLWIGTGDAAAGSAPQDPKSLAGKILRVDRDGKPATGNMTAPFDPRIYSYGHRNVQGIAFAKGEGVQYVGVSTEHGPNVNDEINILKPGNFGWNPVPGYNESVPMTDTASFPDAVREMWASGSGTLAPSGATFVYGDEWGEYNGALMVAMLKGEQIRIFHFDADGTYKEDSTIFAKQFGRIRTIRQGPDGGLYITTDNGNNQDVIVHVTPGGL